MCDENDRKKRKLDDNCDQSLSVIQNMNQVARAVPSNEATPSSIFGLNIDCVEELFEWLSLADILHLRQTCKRFKQIIDYYIKTNFPALRRIYMDVDNFEWFRQMDDSSIDLIEELHILIEPNFDVTRFEDVKRCLNKVSMIYVYPFDSEMDLYDILLKYCSNLKRLLLSFALTTNTGINWLTHHQFPTIEHVGFQIIKKTKQSLDVFFNRNPNIHTFSCSARVLKKYGLSLSNAGVKFNKLDIGDLFQGVDFDVHLFELLNKLHVRGFYKQLRLSLNAFGMSEGDAQMMALPGLEQLRLENAIFTLPALPELKELCMDRCDDLNDFENMKNIERFQVDELDLDRMVYLIEEFPKLKLIKIDKFRDDSPLDLITLNNERQKLAGACKVTIYIDDKIFVDTKWAVTTTDLQLIELKRRQSYVFEAIF